ncbi:MAG: VWA domain-containing protein [Methylocystaceae bacterium]|nr:VWA domain-containing protein [Methylocystaceae bacterium]
MRRILSRITDRVAGQIINKIFPDRSTKTNVSEHTRSLLQRFMVQENGVVAVIFVIVSFPLLYAIGLAVNYTQGNKVLATLQDAADSAALASVAPGVYVRGQNAGAQQNASSAAATSAFMAMVPPGVSITGTSVSTKVNPNGMKGVFSYTASMPAGLLSSVLGRMNLSGTATAYSGIQTAEKVDLFVLIDVSQSMATGADLATQKRMMADPQMSNCDFACHFAGAGDTIAVAARKGYKLRIDVVKEALTTFVTQMKDAAADPKNTLRIGLYTFASGYNEVTPLTTNYDQVLRKIQNLSIPQYYNGTYFQGALDSLRNKIQQYNTPGREKFVMLVTDGVSDSAQAVSNGKGSIVWKVDPATNYSGTTCWGEKPSPDNYDKNGVPQGPFAVPTTAPRNARPCVPDPYVPGTKKIGSHAGQPEFSLMGIDPSWCNGIKNIGVTMTTLYVQFGELPRYSNGNQKDWFRNEWRYIFLNNYVIPYLPTYMSQCASSPGDAFTANDAASVQAAFATIFDRYMTAPIVRLTH